LKHMRDWAQEKYTRSGNLSAFAHYKYYPKIEVPAEKCEDCQKCVDICPKKVLAMKGEKVDVRDLFGLQSLYGLRRSLSQEG